ncbi:hypothetical protein ACH436_17010 [Isoptericola sp. NPDC019693]|uniref:hypothetical protein n=1 Tax=Isoptericola sp. NPDC019693 TaxID=3364009 RepID=UPI0037A3F346
MRPAPALLAPDFDDVRRALSWALDHDLPALIEHRQVAHLGTAARRRADVLLVLRWQRAAARCPGLLA